MSDRLVSYTGGAKLTNHARVMVTGNIWFQRVMTAVTLGRRRLGFFVEKYV